MATLTGMPCKYKVHKLRQRRYINPTRGTSSSLVLFQIKRLMWKDFRQKERRRRRTLGGKSLTTEVVTLINSKIDTYGCCQRKNKIAAQFCYHTSGWRRTELMDNTCQQTHSKVTRSIITRLRELPPHQKCLLLGVLSKQLRFSAASRDHYS